MSSFHELNFKDIDGNDMSFEKFKDKVVYVTNVASAWGFTRRHYTELQELQVFGFPCNQFKNQEPKEEAEIKKFCSENYNVSFTLMSKSDVNGDNRNNVYQWLKNAVKDDSDIKWNFSRIFLIDRSGTKVQQFDGYHRKGPSELIPHIEELLSSSGNKK